MFETAIKDHSGLRYKIQMRRVGSAWEQRHVWYSSPERLNEYREDEWIYSGVNPPSKGYCNVDTAAH